MQETQKISVHQFSIKLLKTSFWAYFAQNNFITLCFCNFMQKIKTFTPLIFIKLQKPHFGFSSASIFKSDDTLISCKKAKKFHEPFKEKNSGQTEKQTN